MFDKHDDLNDVPPTGEPDELPADSSDTEVEQMANGETARPEPDWDFADPRWRQFTYLDCIADYPPERQEHELWRVLMPTFAPDQPTEFAEFAGCLAHFTFSAIGVEEDRQRALMLGLAGSGVRVPGTKFVLRVARPMHAFFQEQHGNFPALPHNWMEALHLSKGGWEEPYEWIGRRHDWSENVTYWDRYEETPSGWCLKPRPAPQLTEAQWQAEIDRLTGQLTQFIDDLLPSIALRDPGVFIVPIEPDARSYAHRLRSLDEWTAAARRLRGVVSAELTPMPRTMDMGYFRRFTHSEPSIDYTVEDGRIHWKISCYSEIDWLSAAHMMFRGRHGWPPQDASHPGFSIEATKRFLLAGSTEDSCYYNEYIWMLAALADSEPDFVKTMLDPEAWRQRIESNPTYSDERRKRELHRLTAPIPGGYFRMVIHNALLHVIGALANNRFDEIRPYIFHQEFPGRYSDLVPHYLFANLLAKAHTIQKHCPNRCKYGPNRRFLGWTVR
jgi:hypothetical protein